ncbi:hypothetical protein F66182_4312 [Fusarium sp. NRRL 66182]|nr:hypothetical protein F66182_4312 [Fusarium sp. NRRL 66182]
MLSKPLISLSALLVLAAAAPDHPHAPSAEPFANNAAATASESDSPTSTTDEAATGTSSGEATTHTINVGASGHKFTPSEVKAEVGDILEWRFYPSSHWVIRGDYENPCIPYEYVDLDRTGFSSGTEKVEAITDDGPRYRVRVNDTDPIWFYCGAPGSCVRYHMMGVVNPTKNETLDDWQERAKDVDFQLRPGDPWPTEEDFPSATADPGASDEESTDDSGSDSDGGGGGKKGLSTGAIAGIAVGGAAVLLLAGALLYLCGRRGGFDKAYRKGFRSSVGPPGPPVTETQYASPNPTVADPWAPAKSPGLMATSYTQSPPLSPHQSLPYGTHPGMVSQDGTPMSYYDPHPTQYSDHHHYGAVAASPASSPKPPDQIAPVELPGSQDPGNSPLPSYNNSDQPRTFSWAGDESGYRPAK